MLDDILKQRNAVQANIMKGFSERDDFREDMTLFEEFGDDVEKAWHEGDVVYKDGKRLVYARTKAGSSTPFAWHVDDKKKKVVKGKGINGLHGMKLLDNVYTKIDKSYTDPQQMNLKRTPNGNWRLWYNNQDTGMTIEGDSITQSELEADNVCYQARNAVDNFDLVGDYMEFNSPDDVYFVQIIKRWKDNKSFPDADAWKAKGKQEGTYHSGAEYMNYYLVHSKAELDALKPEIIKHCSYNNARAYISINPRKESETQAYIPKFKSRFKPSDPQYKFAEPIVYGMAKSGAAWRNERFKVLLDIDTTRDAKTTMPNGSNVNIWDETVRRLDKMNIKIAAKYETPSGGLHLILNNKNNRNLKDFYRGLKDFDNGRDLGKMATVHPSEDIKMVLYSNVYTEGY